MKKILYILIFPFLLFSCATEEENNTTENNKQAFYVDTKKIVDFNGSLFLEKTGKLSSSQEIKLSSQVSGRVADIYVKEGDNVQVGEVLARLNDNIANYYLALDRAKNSLERAKINYDSTKLSLDKQIFDSEVYVDKLKLSLETLKNDTEENLKKAKNDLENSISSQTGSKSSLELEKLDNSIKKQELDLENKKVGDNEIILGYSTSLKKEYSNLYVYLNDIIEFSDKILGVTSENEDENDSFEDYLGVKNTIQKNQTISYFNELLKFRDNELSFLQFNEVSEEQIKNTTSMIIKGYELSSKLLSSLEETFHNSIVSVGSLGESDISGYIATINQYQSTYILNYNTILSFQNNINNFFKTYILNYDSLEKQISLLKEERDIMKKSLETQELNSQVNYNKLILSSQDSIDSLNLDLKTAINNLDNAKKNKEISLKNLQNSINDTNISYKQALDNIVKLTITSPINGTIGEIFIDEGQEVGPNKELFSISNNSSNEVVISFSKDELLNINIGDLAFVKIDDITYTGSIYSISNIADSNLKYISRISFPDGVNLIGNLVNVEIPFFSDRKLLPVNIVKVDNSGRGLINILKDGKIEQKQVNIGKIYGDKIEILDEINPELDIIISDIDNYDENKFEIMFR